MFNVYPYTVEATDTAANPHKEIISLSSGMIHQVDILFQKDSAHKINVQVWMGGHQLWPSNRGKAFRGDATIISFREFLELKGAVNDLHALFWTTDASVLKEVIVQIGLLPREAIQPISFDQLTEAILAL